MQHYDLPERQYRWLVVLLMLVPIVDSLSVKLASLLNAWKHLPVATVDPIPDMSLIHAKDDSVRIYHFRGSVGHKAHNQCEGFIQVKNGEILGGSYWYPQWLPEVEKFELGGSLSSNQLILSAKLSSTGQVEIFNGRLNKNNFKGTWKIEGKAGVEPFELMFYAPVEGYLGIATAEATTSPVEMGPNGWNLFPMPYPTLVLGMLGYR
ncbi:MAG: hypothetical protein R2810_14645 [Flavobacteriales bacterium]|nr:hypothetical protein [Flavobacteriales bacterium]